MALILAINPGSTSTKIAVYENEKCLWKDSIEHSYEEMAAYKDIYEQYPMRVKIIKEFLKKHGTSEDKLSAIVGRGGPATDFKSGAYRMNKELADLMVTNPINNHVSLLGGIIAFNMAEELGIPSFIYDPVSINEFPEIAKISGLKGIERKSAGHFLNIRAGGRKVATEIGKDFNDVTLLAAHLGGGITVAILHKGKVIDLISDDEGPMSPERTGGLPLRQVIDLAEKYDKKTLNRIIRGDGGVVSYLGITDMREVEKRIEAGDKEAKLIFDAMVYQVSNWLSYLAPIVNGKIDGIFLTGGIAYSERFTNAVKEKLNFLGPVFIVPGENELESLALGALRVLRGEEEANIYKD
ncbi:MAG: butyrate kinase [Tissierellia bacterium]|nr:butyrate kinase [Tissierellia bacterium]